MKIFILLFFLALNSFAESVSIYSTLNDVKIYTAGANLALIYDAEKEAIYHTVSAENSLRIAQILYERNQKDLKNLNVSGSQTADANAILQKLIHNPIAGLNPINPYNQDSNAGFCFGRALFVEKELQKQGVHKQNILKVFVLGELFDGNIVWDYHVATMYIDPHGKKLMIDSLFDQVYEIEFWFQKMNQYALNNKNPIFRIYFAQADKFQARSGEMSSFDFLDPRYRNYFLDLLIWL